MRLVAVVFSVVGHVPPVVVHGIPGLVVLVSVVLGNMLVQVWVMAVAVVCVFGFRWRCLRIC